MLIRVRREKSMCFAAKGRLQGWAAKLLLLWVGIFHFFSFQICNHVTAVSFFRLAYNDGTSFIAIIFLFLFKKSVVILPNRQCNNSSQFAVSNLRKLFEQKPVPAGWTFYFFINRKELKRVSAWKNNWKGWLWEPSFSERNCWSVFFEMLWMGVQTALLFRIIFPPPAASPEVFSRLNGPCAGGAANAHKTPVVQYVVRHIVFVHVPPAFIQAPMQHRVVFNNSKPAVVVKQR